MHLLLDFLEGLVPPCCLEVLVGLAEADCRLWMNTGQGLHFPLTHPWVQGFLFHPSALEVHWSLSLQRNMAIKFTTKENVNFSDPITSHNSSISTSTIHDASAACRNQFHPPQPSLSLSLITHHLYRYSLIPIPNHHSSSSSLLITYLLIPHYHHDHPLPSSFRHRPSPPSFPLPHTVQISPSSKQ